MFSRTIDAVQGNARLAQASIGEEVETAISQTDKDVAIGGATLASAASVWVSSAVEHPSCRLSPRRFRWCATSGSRVILERYRRVV